MLNRSAVAALLLVVALLAGCASEPEPRVVTPAAVDVDPTTVRVASVRVENHTVLGDGGVDLAVRAYIPTLTEGAKPGLALFVHGWGGNKEDYEGVQSFPVPTPIPVGSNRLQMFADAGLLAVAYDARGFGRSGGEVTVAGPAEMADLHAVLVWAQSTFATNGLAGVIGNSYGGGHAFNAWADDPLVTTAVPIYGWVDLADALIPGNVPKAEWGEFLYLYGQAGTGRYSTMIHDWYTDLYLRADLDTVRAEMDERSSLDRLASTTKPLLVCQGMEESLFPQIDQAWGTAGGFTRAYVFRGGHGSAADGCWERALDWFRFFLLGFDTRVDAWPALETVDAASDVVTSYTAFPVAPSTAYNLRSGELYPGPASEASFTISQRFVANPIEEPAALWDQTGMPTNALPNQLRQDPGAVTFQGPFLAGGTLVGAPELTLALHGETPAPFQVAGTLLVLHEDGTSQIVSRGATAALDADDIVNGAVTLRFHWTHLALQSGDRIVLKLSANDPAWWMPLLATYDAAFDGRSELRLPIL